MKITIYELLGMIKDGKAPKKIKYNKYLDRIGGKDIYEEEIYIYDKKEKNYYRENDEKHEYWTTAFMIIPDLEDEVEILETTLNPKDMNITIPSKKIEKLDIILDEHFTNDELQVYIYETQVKINEIIDYINKEVK